MLHETRSWSFTFASRGVALRLNAATDKHPDHWQGGPASRLRQRELAHEEARGSRADALAKVDARPRSEHSWETFAAVLGSFPVTLGSRSAAIICLTINSALIAYSVSEYAT